MHIPSPFGNIAIGLAASLFTVAPTAADEVITKAMDFDACQAYIRHMSTKLGIAPTNIVETSILRMVRFPAADGSVLVTCSGPDKKMILQPTSKVCGVDVEC